MFELILEFYKYLSESYMKNVDILPEMLLILMMGPLGYYNYNYNNNESKSVLFFNMIISVGAVFYFYFRINDYLAPVGLGQYFMLLIVSFVKIVNKNKSLS